MKKLILMLLLTTATFTTQAQDVRFTSSGTSNLSESISAETVNLGVAIEYQMTMVYFKAYINTMPSYYESSLSEFGGVPIGFNYQSRFRNFRAFVGLKLGTVKRNGARNATYGFESGVEFYPNGESSGFYFGGQFDLNRRNDMITVGYDNEDLFFKGNTLVKFGYAW